MVKNNKGTDTIKLAVYFWTNLKDKEKYGNIELPKKTCWDSGFVSAVSNNKHGIRSGIFKHFNSMAEIPSAIKDVLKRSEITVVQSKKDREYKEALQKIKESQVI